jgi:cell division protease FtsH
MAEDRAVSGLERKSRIISEKEKEVVSYHEMGHALVALQQIPSGRSPLCLAALRRWV